jgi:hypothetical protein
MKDSMNISIESRRKMVVDWMIDLPFGENDAIIEKAIDNAILSGKDRDEVINLISLSFITELNDYLKWSDDSNLDAFTEYGK